MRHVFLVIALALLCSPVVSARPSRVLRRGLGTSSVPVTPGAAGLDHECTTHNAIQGTHQLDNLSIRESFTFFCTTQTTEESLPSFVVEDRLQQLIARKGLKQPETTNDKPVGTGNNKIFRVTIDFRKSSEATVLFAH